MRFTLAALVLSVAGSLCAEDSPSKYALFVGVSKYNHTDMNKPQLEFPESDAKELGNIFRNAGYTIDLLLGKDATQQAIRTKLSRLDKKGGADGAIVIGLFGHGVEFESTKIACFCPFDTTIRNVVDGKGRNVLGDDGKSLTEPNIDSLITMEELLAALRTSPAGNRVLLADCCRNSPNKARGRAFGSNVKLTDLPENTAALFACSSNEQAFEHRDWKHGAFTKCLIDEMNSEASHGRVTAGKLADELQPKVKKLVASATGGKTQTLNPIVNGVVDLKLSSLNSNDGTDSKTNPAQMRDSDELTEKYFEDFRGAPNKGLPDGWVIVSKRYRMGVRQDRGRAHLRTSGESGDFRDNPDGGQSETSSARLPPVDIRGDFVVELTVLCNQVWEKGPRGMNITLMNQKDEKLILRCFEDNTGFVATLPNSDESKPFSLAGANPYRVRFERKDGTYRFVCNSKQLLSFEANDRRNFNVCEIEVSPQIMIGSVKIGPLDETPVEVPPPSKDSKKPPQRKGTNR